MRSLNTNARPLSPSTSPTVNIELSQQAPPAPKLLTEEFFNHYESHPLNVRIRDALSALHTSTIGMTLEDDFYGGMLVNAGMDGASTVGEIASVYFGARSYLQRGPLTQPDGQPNPRYEAARALVHAMEAYSQ